MKQENYAQAIRKSIEESKRNETMICCGLGVTDPKGVFDTTTDLHKEFGIKDLICQPPKMP